MIMISEATLRLANEALRLERQRMGNMLEAGNYAGLEKPAKTKIDNLFQAEMEIVTALREGTSSVVYNITNVTAGMSS
jgi:hypothetical protein